MQETNPYKSPEADFDKRMHGFRWRIIPTTLIAIFAGLHLVGACIMELRFLQRSSPGDSSLSFGILLWFACGITGCISAVAWWKGRWWGAILGTIAWILLGVWASYLAH